MSRFYQKYLSNLPNKGEGQTQKVDPTSMTSSNKAGGVTGAGAKGTSLPRQSLTNGSLFLPLQFFDVLVAST
jgi:hypothetical protein